MRKIFHLQRPDNNSEPVPHYVAPSIYKAIELTKNIDNKDIAHEILNCKSRKKQKS